MNAKYEKDGSYAELVRTLAKSGELILRELTPEQCHLWHMGTGCATEGGEVLDACKKYAVYQQPLDRANVIEELGDLEFFMEGVRQAIGVTREEVLAANVRKLRVRYGQGYSNAAAQARADKWQNPKAEGRSPKETRSPKSEESGVQTPAQAFVDEAGVFHCSCGRTHDRGPWNGGDVYRCLGCGNTYRPFVQTSAPTPLSVVAADLARRVPAMALDCVSNNEALIEGLLSTAWPEVHQLRAEVAMLKESRAACIAREQMVRNAYNQLQASASAWPTVDAFAGWMRGKLEQNRHKGNRAAWLACDPWHLLPRLRQEVDELEQALIVADAAGGVPTPEAVAGVQAEAADVGNFAMMLADVIQHRVK